jgi:hypothetical protein
MTIEFAGDPDTLVLMTPQPGSDFTGPWVQERFYMGQHGNHRALFAQVRLDASSPQTAPSPVVLLDHVTQVRFAYFGSAADGAPADWRESWINSSRLPDLVRVAIARDDPKLPSWPELIVATRETANAGCIYTGYGTACQRAR